MKIAHSDRRMPHWMRFLSYYRPYLGWLAADLLCAGIVSAATLLIPLCARIITQDLLTKPGPTALRGIAMWGAIMVGLVAIRAGAEFFVDYRGHVMGALMESDMRRDLFDHYQRLPYSFYDDHTTGHLMSRLTNDLFSVSELAHHGPEDAAIGLLKFTGAFVILLMINVPLTLIIFLFMPIMGLYALYFNRRMNSALGHSKARIGDVNAQAEDTLAGIRVVKSFVNEPIEAAKFAHENARFVDSRRAGYRSEAFFYGGMGAFTELFTIAVIIFGGVAIVQSQLELPDLLTFLLYVGSLVEPINRGVNLSRLYQEGATGFSRFLEMLAIPTEAPTASSPLPAPIRGEIEFRAVHFRYRDAPDPVFRDLSMKVRAGEYVALVGTSGVGKSTLCALIPRFYEINAGTILIDGTPIQQMALGTLRRAIGVVQQDVYLFNGTVADNVRYGKPDATDAEIVAAAQAAHAHDFIMTLQNGYATHIGQRGVKLSGGQKQRLSIARVFLKDPPIIIFDEATSSLDTHSESAVQLAIETLTAHRTMLVIAHRLSTIRNADRIIVLSAAGIVEEGTHTELMAQNGLYANLYTNQARL